MTLRKKFIFFFPLGRIEKCLWSKQMALGRGWTRKTTKNSAFFSLSSWHGAGQRLSSAQQTGAEPNAIFSVGCNLFCDWIRRRAGSLRSESKSKAAVALLKKRRNNNSRRRGLFFFFFSPPAVAPSTSSSVLEFFIYLIWLFCIFFLRRRGDSFCFVFLVKLLLLLWT